jgi:DUF917 family protein
MQLDVADLEAYARGCAILGTGGGGDVGIPALAARAALRTHGPVDVVDLDDLPDDALVMPVAGWGAPTVAIEKFESGEEIVAVRDAVERWFARRVDVLLIGEIGGGNGVAPVGWAARLGLGLVDADGMGRAFPEGDQVSMHVAGVPPSPAFQADERGNVLTLEPVDGRWLERLGRAGVMAFGGTVTVADHVMDVATARTATVRGTVTQALRIGRALETGGLDEVVRACAAVRLAGGKVADVERRTTGGFARGVVSIHGTREDAGRRIQIHVQNENLLATEGDRMLACVPDLIVLADEATGDAVPTERVRYGQRLVVLGLPCAPIWRTPAGLRVAGPDRFGFPHEYRPVEEAM